MRDILLSVNGKTWTLTGINANLRKRFSAWAQATARNQITAQKRSLSEDSYIESQNHLTAAIAAGHYTWGTVIQPDRLGSALRIIMDAQDGQMMLLEMLLAKNHPHVSEQQVLDLFVGDPDAVAMAMAKALGYVAEDAPPPMGADTTDAPAASVS